MTDYREAFERFRDDRNAALEREGHKPGSKCHVDNSHYQTWQAARAQGDAEPVARVSVSDSTGDWAGSHVSVEWLARHKVNDGDELFTGQPGAETISEHERKAHHRGQTEIIERMCQIINALLDGNFEPRHGLLEPWLSTHARLVERLSIPSTPNEHGKNRYGLDMAYFRNLFNRELNRPLLDFRPDELARVLARASKTADASVLQESEFHLSAGVPEGFVLMPESLTAENGAKYALSGEFNEVVELECTACDGDDEGCDVCSGNGSYTYRVPVSWTTIKNIYRKVVSRLSISTPPLISIGVPASVLSDLQLSLNDLENGFTICESCGHQTNAEDSPLDCVSWVRNAYNWAISTTSDSFPAATQETTHES